MRYHCKNLITAFALVLISIVPCVASAVDDKSGATTALSVAPLDQPTYPEDRPAWIDQVPDLDDDPIIWPVKSLLRSSAEEAVESLQVQVNGAMAAYAEQLLGPEAADAMGNHPLVSVDIDSFDGIDRYSGTATLGESTMYEEAARLRLDKRYEKELKRASQERVVGNRLAAIGFIGGGSLCLLLTGTGIARRFARKAS
jgi:hypothetical protein